MHFTEDMFEQAVIELFENMGYTHIYAPDMERDYSSPLLDSVLMDSLVKLNKGLPLDAITEAINKLHNFDTGSLLQKNMQFMDYLQNGITVRYFVKGEERTSIVYLIDYATRRDGQRAGYAVAVTGSTAETVQSARRVGCRRDARHHVGGKERGRTHHAQG